MLRGELVSTGRFARAPAAALAFHGDDETRLFAGCERAVVERRLVSASGDAADEDDEILLATCADEVSALSVHPSQPLLAIADDSGTITLVDTSTRSLLRTLSTKGHESLATAVLVAPPASWIAPGVALPAAWVLSGGCDTQCLLWDAGLVGERGPLSSLSPGVAAAAADADAGVADAMTAINPSYVHALAWGPLPPDPTGAAARGSAPAALAAAALGDGRVALISVIAPADGGVRRGRAVPRLGSGARLALHWAAKAHPSAVCALAVVDLGARCGGGDGGGDCGASARGASSDFEDAWGVQTTANKHILVSASNDGTFCVWDLGVGEMGQPRTWQHTNGRVNVLAGGLGYFAVATTRKALSVYDCNGFSI